MCLCVCVCVSVIVPFIVYKLNTKNSLRYVYIPEYKRTTPSCLSQWMTVGD